MNYSPALSPVCVEEEGGGRAHTGITLRRGPSPRGLGGGGEARWTLAKEVERRGGGGTGRRGAARQVARVGESRAFDSGGAAAAGTP